MPINKEDIAKIARLAHIEITPEELSVFGPQIAGIVSYVEQLNEVVTSQIDPALGGLTPEGEQTDAARNDAVLPSLGQQLALEEAPDASDGHFRVPKVL